MKPGNSNEQMQIEIIKENGDTTVCPQMTNYPLDVYGAAGASFPDKTTVVCGGYDNGYRADCYKLTKSQWESFGQLQTARSGHAATRIGAFRLVYRCTELVVVDLAAEGRQVQQAMMIRAAISQKVASGFTRNFQ